MIELNHLQKSYPGFVMDLSLSVPAGSITALIGPNGSGKTTLFRLLLGLSQYEGGKAELFGEACDSLSAKTKKRIGVVFNDSGFPGELCGNDLPSILHGFFDSFDENEWKRLTTKLNLDLSQMISKLSTGQAARLKLCAALSHHPELLILDEPTSGLDVVARDEILDLLREFMESPDHSILISSHISSDLETLCDQVCMIQNGSILLNADMETIESDFGILSQPAAEENTADPDGFLFSLTENGIRKTVIKNRQFYLENYPDLSIEKCHLDDLLLITTKGERV